MKKLLQKLISDALRHGNTAIGSRFGNSLVALLLLLVVGVGEVCFI